MEWLRLVLSDMVVTTLNRIKKWGTHNIAAGIVIRSLPFHSLILKTCIILLSPVLVTIYPT